MDPPEDILPPGPDSRAKTAFHEAGHVVAAVALDIPVDAASLRPGKGFHGVTLIGPPTADRTREEAERVIVMVQAGEVGARFVEPLTGRPTPKAERVVVASLRRRSPAVLDRLAEAEVDDDHEDDEAAAMGRSWSLCDHNDWIAQAHVLFLRRWALHVVERHLRALRVVAAALYQRTVLDGDKVAAMVRGFRCGCMSHLDWGPPPASVP